MTSPTPNVRAYQSPTENVEPDLSQNGSPSYTERDSLLSSSNPLSYNGIAATQTDNGGDANRQCQYRTRRRSTLSARSRGLRRFSLTEEDETRTEHPDPTSSSSSGEEEGAMESNTATRAAVGAKPNRPVTWRELPHKGQLAILTLARLSEPLTQTSLLAYLFHQLKSFDPSLPDSTISAQAGMVQASFTAAQFLTAVWWGRLADAAWMGRKRIILIGLFGSCLSCLGFGFSRSYASAMAFRIIGGLMNSNVGVMRTMIAEIIEEKKFQSRAFLLLPMCFNVGVVIGPILGGSLANPIENHPSLFGPGSWLGGKDGVWWMRQWPFALPNLVCAFFLIISWNLVFLGLDETHEIARYRPDWGRELGRSIVKRFRGSRADYSRLHQEPGLLSPIDVEHASLRSARVRTPSPVSELRRPESPWRHVFQRNVILTLVTHFLLAMHTSAFNNMIFVFLPMSRQPEGTLKGFLHFSGGLGLSSSHVGLATAIIGIVGLPLQLLVYPRVQFRLGTLRSFRTFLPLSPLAYTLMPFLVIIPRAPYLVWPAFILVVSLQVISRTFVLPAGIILVNNSVTESTVLGTIHGIAQSTSSAARTLGPLLGGLGLGLGSKNDIVGAAWWALAVEALLGWFVSWAIYEGKGIERKKSSIRPRR